MINVRFRRSPFAFLAGMFLCSEARCFQNSLQIRGAQGRLVAVIHVPSTLQNEEEKTKLWVAYFGHQPGAEDAFAVWSGKNYYVKLISLIVRNKGLLEIN